MTTVPAFLLRLELDEQADERAIKRAYARELKLIDQALHPEAFQMLREAYEVSLNWFKHRPSHPAIAPEISDASQKSDPANAPIAPDAALIENVESSIRETEESRHSEAAIQADTTAVERYLAGFRSFCDDMVKQGEIDSDIPWQIELRSILSNPEFDSMYARGLFEANIVYQLASGWHPGHQTLFMAASSVFKWQEDPRRLTMFGQSGEIIDRATWEYSLFDELRGESYYKTARRLIQQLREGRPPRTRDVLKYLPLLEMLLANYPTWLAIVSNVGNVQMWREKDQSIPAWQKKMLNFVLIDGRTESSWTLARRNWKGLLFFAILMACWWGSENTNVFDTRPNSSYSSKNSSTNSGTANGSGQVDPAIDWMGQIKRNLVYSPPLGVVGNPAVEYRMRLFTDGGIMKTELLKSSGWPDFDEAVLRALQKTQPFTAEVPRDFIVSYMMFANRLADASAKKALPEKATPAAYLRPPRPIYPPDATKNGVEGTVSLRVLVNSEGLPEQIEIQTSSGVDSLDQAGIEAVKRAVFRPYKEDGKPVSAYVVIPINFTLNRR